MRLQELGEKIVEQTNNLYPKKQNLKTINLKEKDVFEEKLVYDLMQKVAQIFAPTVTEIKKRSPSNVELSLKSEDESGKRNEIYLKKSEVKEKLDAINEKGAKLLELLDVNLMEMFIRVLFSTEFSEDTKKINSSTINIKSNYFPIR